jgi:hypothetical protein
MLVQSIDPFPPSLFSIPPLKPEEAIMRRTFRGLVAFLAAVSLSTLGLVVMSTSPAAAAYGNSSCPSSRPAVYPQSSWQFFSAHKIVVNNKVCKILGPLNGFIYVNDPSISLPTTIPGGGVGEQVSVSAGPTLIFGSNTKVVHRFTIKQTVLHIPGATAWVFDVVHELFGSTYKVRICTLNGGTSCNSWTTF